MGESPDAFGNNQKLTAHQGDPTQLGRALMPLGTAKNLQRMRRWQNEKGVADRRRKF